MSVIDQFTSSQWRRRWLVVGGGSLVTVAVGTTALGSVLDFRAALLWAGVASAILAGEVWFYHSRREGWSRPAAIGAANAVTMGRGWLFAAVGGFAVLQPSAAIAWVPGLCYGAGVALDQIDGRLARHTDTESNLGERLDMAVDTLGFVVAPVVAVAWGRLPVWYLSLAAARYLFKLGRGYRRWRDLPVSELSPSSIRRTLSGVQMAFLTLALLPLVPVDVLAVVAVAVLTPSLAMFVRDYLVVAGRLRPGSDA